MSAMTPGIIEQSFRIRLVGKRGTVVGSAYGETGRKLMGEMWSAIKSQRISNRGINHWVYLPGDEMFTGVELTHSTDKVEGLEHLDVELPRYLRAVHVGPYAGLPQAWAELKAHIEQSGERSTGTGMEIYAHWLQDETRLETIILLGLQPPGA